MQGDRANAACVYGVDPFCFVGISHIPTKMVVDTELEEAKAAVLQLMNEKDKLEAELQAAKSILDNVSIV